MLLFVSCFRPCLSFECDVVMMYVRGFVFFSLFSYFRLIVESGHLQRHLHTPLCIAALKEGNLQEAHALYLQAFDEKCEDVAILCNVSLVTFKQEEYKESIKYADQAIDMLLQGHAELQDDDFRLLAMAFHRKAQAQCGAGQMVSSIRTYKEGLRICQQKSSELEAAARLQLDQMPHAWLAQYWSACIVAGEKPNQLSSRDGILLKPVKSQIRLEKESLTEQLCCAFEDPVMENEAKDAIVAVWSKGRSPGRAEVALFRALAYHNASHAEQALKDIELSLAYGPHSDGKSTWLAALVLHSSILESLGKNVPSLVSTLHALELDPELDTALAALDRILRRVPEHYALAVESGGVGRLLQVIQEEKERAMPEFMKPRPKYYYYYEWMRKRIEAAHPNLPEPVMDKLLTLEATELDLLIRYPVAIQNTVSNLKQVLEDKGEEFLSTYSIPLLSFDEVQKLESGQSVKGSNHIAAGNDPLDTILEAAQEDDTSDKGSIDIEEADEF